MILTFILLTCNTAFISSRSSVGFHRPKSLVICRGCLLFFTLLVMGAGFTTMVRGGVRAVPDFVTWQSRTKAQKISIKPVLAYHLCHEILRESVDSKVFCTFFFSLDEGSLPEQRTGSMTGGPLTLLDDFTRLLSTSSSSNFFLFIDLRNVCNESLNMWRRTTEKQHKTFTATDLCLLLMPTKCSNYSSIVLVKPGGTSAFGNTTAKSLCCRPLHIFYSEWLFVLWPTLSTSSCHRCTDHRVTCLHLFSHNMRHIRK